MDNLLDSKVSDNQKLEFNSEGASHLLEIRKWTNFLSILGYVFLGLLILISIGALAVAGSAGGGPFAGFAIIPAVLIGALYFFPIYYLLKFSTISKQAINENDSNSLTEAFRYLKMHYRFIGIFTIVILGIYALVLVVALITGSMMSFFM